MSGVRRALTSRIDSPLSRRLHLHRLGPTWKRSRELAPSRLALTRIWWVLALGYLERRIPTLRSSRQRRVTVVGWYGARRLYLRANAWDTFTFYEVFLKQVYRAALPLQPDATVVDLGANIGLASAYFSMHSRNCHFIAVEPDSENFAMLKRNLEGVEARFVEAAIDATTGNALLALAAPVRHHLARDGEAPATVKREVPTLTIDDLLESEDREHIDVLKVDIEGTEERAFADPPRSLKRVELVIMEIHNPDSATSIENVLHPMGFRHDTRARGQSHLDMPDVFRRVGGSDCDV